MKSIPPWVTYTLLRLLLIAVPLVLLLLIQVPWYFAAIIAAVVGLCLSYLLLSGSRNAVSTELYNARARGKKPVTPDDEAEDAVADASETSSSEPHLSEPHLSEAQGEAEESTVSETDNPGQLKR